MPAHCYPILIRFILCVTCIAGRLDHSAHHSSGSNHCHPEAFGLCIGLLNYRQPNSTGCQCISGLDVPGQLVFVYNFKFRDT